MVIYGHLVLLVTDPSFANILRQRKLDISASLSALDITRQLVPLSLFVYFLQGVVTKHCCIFHVRLRKYNVNFISDRIPNLYRFCDVKIRSSITCLTSYTWSNNHGNFEHLSTFKTIRRFQF